MKPWLGLLSVCFFSQNLLAQTSDETLSVLHRQSDVVVLGEFSSEPLGEMDEQGVVGYHAEFEIAQLLKGSELGTRKPGGTIVVNMIRFEFEEGDRHPLFTKEGKAILFLKSNNRQSRVTYTIFDKWFGIQPAFPTLAKTLTKMSDEKNGQQDANIEHLSNRGLEGDWRIFLPAGYELEISLKSLGNDRYSLLPASYTFSGTYRIEGDRLVSEDQDDARRGQFAWKIVSDYLTTLVDQVEGVGSSYSGAIMFRLSPTAILERQQAEKAKLIPLHKQPFHLKGVPQISVGQLREEIRKEGFQWRYIGREIEFISSQRNGNLVQIDGMERETLDTAAIHLSEAKADRDRLANLGEKIRIRGLIVDQWYGVWQIWPYSMTDVKASEIESQTKKAFIDAVE